MEHQINGCMTSRILVHLCYSLGNSKIRLSALKSLVSNQKNARGENNGGIHSSMMLNSFHSQTSLILNKTGTTLLMRLLLLWNYILKKSFLILTNADKIPKIHTTASTLKYSLTMYNSSVNFHIVILILRNALMANLKGFLKQNSSKELILIMFAVYHLTLKCFKGIEFIQCESID